LKDLIFYPGFEFTDNTWVKFALLYIDKLNPIIPDSGESHLSDSFRRILNETDLIHFHRPTFNEGNEASLEAMTIMERIIQRPNNYIHPFWNKNYRTINYVEKWRESQNQNYTLFREKYTYEFSRFCSELGIAHECDEGINVPQEVAYLYMSLLANIIAESRGVSTITDNPVLDRFTVFSRVRNRREYAQLNNRLNVARQSIGLYLPDNLTRVKLEDIISLRNCNDFRETLKAFHTELDRYFNIVENDGSALDFVDSLEYSLKNIRRELLKLSPTMFTFIIGVWTLINSGSHDYMKYIGQTLTFGSIGASMFKISDEWKTTKNKRFAQKYLANLHQLKTKSPTKKLMKR